MKSTRLFGGIAALFVFATTAMLLRHAHLPPQLSDSRVSQLGLVMLAKPAYAAIGDAKFLGSYATLSGTLRATQFIDNSNNSYFLDPNATGTSLNVAGSIVANNLVVSNNISRGSCPTGYILVPGSTTFGTKDFCVMKYAAQQDANKNPTSAAGGTSWVNIDWYEAKAACQRAGAHLITNAEWMTIARNIEATKINDLDNSSHYANGHANNNPANALTGATDPVVTGCTLTSALSDASNAWSSTCQLRGTNGNTSDYGYGGTNSNYSSALSYQASGTATKSELRVAVLSNGQTIHDFAGNVWQWSDWQCTNGGPWYYTAAWLDWNNANLTGYAAYAGGSLTHTSANGIGQYYGCSATGNAAIRGGRWTSGALGGPFTLHLDTAPSSVLSNIGFRCAM